MTDFYSFEWDAKKGEVFLRPFIEYDEGRLLHGEITITTPLQMRIDEGKNFYEFTRFQDTSNFAVSQKVAELLRNEGLKGWAAFPINIEGVDFVYWGFQVFGRCGQLKRPSSAGFVKGYEFDINSWDGSDFFSPGGTNAVFCTSRAKDVIVRVVLKNLKLENITTVEWYSTGKKE